MTFRVDESRIRKAQGPLVFNIMRNIAMVLFKQDDTKRASMEAKKKMAGLTMNIVHPCWSLGLKCASRGYSPGRDYALLDF
jgi:hypothetical protein